MALHVSICVPEEQNLCLLEITAGAGSLRDHRGLTLALPTRYHIMRTFFTVPFTEGQLIELIHELCRRITNNNIQSMCEHMTLQFSQFCG